MKKIFTILVLLSSFSAFAQKKMNVIFFVVDDLGWKDVSYAGSKFYETPNIDNLASDGITFTNAYAAHPRCVPSRFAMMTGKFPARLQNPGEKVEFKPGEKTIGAAFKENGYKTFFTGKWHLGHDEINWPHNQGFDVNKGGCAAGAPRSYFYPYNKVRKESKGHKASPIVGLDNAEEGKYITDHLTDETIKFIEANKDKPFMATVMHYAVHTPLQAKKELVKKYRQKLKTMQQEGEEFSYGVDGRTKLKQNDPVYAAMVQSMDESLGRIVKCLKDNGLYDNTIILLSSDHGGLSNSGTKNKRPLATSNLPLRAGKGHLYEGGVKVPLVVYSPKLKKHGKTNESLVVNTDFYPTLLEMVGAPLQPEQHVDGVSFAKALKGKTINKDREVFWHSPKGRPRSTGDRNCSVYRKGNFKLMHYYDTNEFELYDLEADPYEQSNLASSSPELKTTMANRLKEWKKEVNAWQGKNGKKKRKNAKKKHRNAKAK